MALFPLPHRGSKPETCFEHQRMGENDDWMATIINDMDGAEIFVKGFKTEIWYLPSY